MSSNAPAYIHHVNFPTTDIDRTREWYGKVFGMKAITPKSNTKVLLMTRGNFDLHFTPIDEMDRMAPYHFAVELEDWDGFMAHLDDIGVRHTRITSRPENRSLFCYIHDPDHTMIELVYHAGRPGGAPEVKEYVEKATVKRGANSADEARAQL
ncbi:MAG: VOC family protein [Nocardioides sp.]|uniref:VOC family protein n=1 Tax=Nocardioides sp. TaxID=35761 RepID=UPI0039E2AAD3